MSYDIFYELNGKSLVTVKKILNWAKSNAFKTEVHMRVMGRLAREKADKSYDKVFRLITKEQITFFIIVLRKNLNWFPSLSKEAKKDDVLEIFIRGMDVEDKEYFLIMFLDKEKLIELKKMYQLRPIV